jgi:hypothetical protein
MDVCVEGLDPLFSVRVSATASQSESKFNSLRHIRNRLLHHLEAMVQHQDVDSAHSLQGFPNHILARLMASQICRDEMHFPALLLHQTLRVSRVLLFLRQIDNCALRSLHGIQDCDGTPNAAVAACDEGFSPCELAGCEVGLVATCGSWELVVDRLFAGHLVLQARGLVLVRDGDFVAWRDIVSVSLWKLQIHLSLTEMVDTNQARTASHCLWQP